MVILNKWERNHALPETNEPDYIDSSWEAELSLECKIE